MSCYVNGVATLRCIPCFLKYSINFIFALAGVVAVLFIIMAGVRFITSRGDEIQVEKAKKTLTFAIAGLVIVVFSFAIVNFAGSAFGLKFADLCQSG